VITALVVALSAPPAVAALDSAEACYAALELDCAEEGLAQALAADLAPAALVRARLLDARLGLAHRDQARARAAVRALLAVDPGFELGPRDHPELRALIAEERPEPPPAMAPFVRVDVDSIRLSGDDGDRWSEGLGVDGAAGVILGGRYRLGVAAGYSDHRPRVVELDGLALGTFAATGGVRIPAGPLILTPSIDLGVAHVTAEGVLLQQDYWGFFGQASLDLTFTVYRGLGVGIRVAPAMLAAGDEGRVALSFLLPLGVGVRYGL